MADNTEPVKTSSDQSEPSERGVKRSAPAYADDKQPADDGGTIDKKPKLEEDKHLPRQYKEIRKILRSLNNQVSKTDKDTSRIISNLKKLEEICSQSVSDDEVPPVAMVIQMHLKHAFFLSKNIKDGDNIKVFLNGLEDDSANKSEKDNTIYVFVANHATELWYRWDESSKQWQWTPESHWSLWMPCSTTKVSAGQWKGETPAPENKEIIIYLDTIRPTPRGEVYLNHLYDVAKLLQDLSMLDEEEVKRSVITIAALLRDQKLTTEDEGGYLKAFEEAMIELAN